MQKKDVKAIGSRLMAFLKKNIHYILMILCVVAIGVVVTVVAVMNGKNNDVDVINPDPKPPIEKPDDKPDVEKKFALVMPVEGGVQARGFDKDKLSWNKTLNRMDCHQALDIKGKKGAKVLAGFEGTVTEVTTNDHSGGVVIIDYGKGRIATIKLLADVKVKKGDKVTENTVIGSVGVFQFECKEDAHIHYELKIDGKLVDPMMYIIGADK